MNIIFHFPFVPWHNFFFRNFGHISHFVVGFWRRLNIWIDTFSRLVEYTAPCWSWYMAGTNLIKKNFFLQSPLSPGGEMQAQLGYNLVTDMASLNPSTFCPDVLCHVGSVSWCMLKFLCKLADTVFSIDFWKLKCWSSWSRLFLWEKKNWPERLLQISCYWSMIQLFPG